MRVTFLRSSFMYPKWRSTRDKVTNSVRAIILVEPGRGAALWALSILTGPDVRSVACNPDI